MDPPAAHFDDPAAVAAYAEGPARNVPGWADMLRMAELLLAERVPAGGRVLVVGAGGGLELKRFAASHEGWRFVGVDPSREMLALARATLGPLADRAELVEGHVTAAPAGPFDGASCLLTLHFVPVQERRGMLAEIRQRLRPGAPFVLAHLSVPQATREQRSLWLQRYAAFIASSGVDAEKARGAAQAVDARLTVLSPEEDEAMLRAAGFGAVDLFYAGLAFRGWIAQG